MRLKSFIKTFLLPLPQYHTAPGYLFPLPQRGISHLQETAASQTAREDIGDPDYGFTDVVEER